MIYQVIDFVLFFLVLYFVLPVIMIFAMLIRDFIHQNHKPAVRHRELLGKPAGW